MNRPDDHLTPYGKALVENSSIDPEHEAMVADLTPGKPDVADVIAQGMKPHYLSRASFRPSEGPSLKAISTKLRNYASEWWRAGFSDMASDFVEMAFLLDARHDHADPCDECPCVQAERERWEGEGHGDDCRRNP